ncbi:MAG: hypothetical protein ACLPPF_13645 [Rhodomicrobium sp.]
MRIQVAVVLSLLFSGNALAKDAAALFDKPVSTVKIPLPADPLNPQAKPLLSCFYYKGFAVKQIDRGEVGAEQLSIVPFTPGSAPYKCREPNAGDEKLVDAKDWGGYFKGVKGDYVFFDAADGVNGGLGFAVYRAPDGKKIFEDVAKTWHAIELTPSGMNLRYSRVFAPGCSLYADAAGCWARVKQATGLTQASPPDCSAEYKAEEKRMKGSTHRPALDPSVVDYEAKTVLEAGHNTTSSMPGPLVCRLAD